MKKARRLTSVTIGSVALAVPAFLLAVALQGFLPGLSPPALTWLLGAGNVECLSNSGWSGLVRTCDQVGIPAGLPALLGQPQNRLATLLTLVTGIDSWTTFRLIALACTAAGFTGTVLLLRRWRSPRWVAVVGGYLYQASPSILAMSDFTYSFTGYVLLPLYLWICLRTMDLLREGRRPRAIAIAAATSLVIVFTDGYSMFGSAVLILCLTASEVLRGKRNRQAVVTAAIGTGVWAGALVVSSALYLASIPEGGSDIEVGIGAFRLPGPRRPDAGRPVSHAVVVRYQHCFDRVASAVG